jgi:hypothetical protein
VPDPTCHVGLDEYRSEIRWCGRCRRLTSVERWHVMSQDIVDGRTHAIWVRPSLVFSGMCGGGGDRLAAVGWVEHELAEEFAGGGVDDPDVEVLDQDEDAGSGAVRPMPMEWMRWASPRSVETSTWRRSSHSAALQWRQPTPIQPSAAHRVNGAPTHPTQRPGLKRNNLRPRCPGCLAPPCCLMSRCARSPLRCLI